MVHSHKWFNYRKNKYLICMAVGNCLSVLSRSDNMFLSSYMPFIALILNSALSGLLNEKAWKRIVKITAKHVCVSSWQCAPIEKDYFWIKTAQASMVAVVDYYTYLGVSVLPGKPFVKHAVVLCYYLVNFVSYSLSHSEVQRVPNLSSMLWPARISTMKISARVENK